MRIILSSLEEARQVMRIHTHLSSDDYRKEITVCIYDDARLDGFSDRAKRLMREHV